MTESARERRSRLWSSLAALALLCACDASRDRAPAAIERMPAAEPDWQGRIERFADLRIVRVWGTPEQRGRALGNLLGAEIVALVRAELEHRFARAPQRLEAIRRTLPRLIAWPGELRAELEAMADAIESSVPDRALERFGRQLDRTDLLLVNALDVFGTFGCSGFTAWGGDVEGGGVLSARNFDWPYTGRHMVDSTIVLVEHDAERAIASVTWPGYLGAVTAVNEDGLAVFLHVGNGRRSTAPEPESYPTAAAARVILERAALGDAAAVARDLLERTSPPSSFITRVVLPNVDRGVPAHVFEVDARSVVERPIHEACVITNHFLMREGLRASRDSQQRFTMLTADVDGLRRDGDRQISVAEAWQALARVERGAERTRFGTLHSLVFRAQPWVFELAIGRDGGTGRVQAAPSEGRRYRIPRERLFRDPLAPAPR